MAGLATSSHQAAGEGSPGSGVEAGEVETVEEGCGCGSWEVRGVKVEAARMGPEKVGAVEVEAVDVEAVGL
jgi:hypothetical protein